MKNILLLLPFFSFIFIDLPPAEKNNSEISREAIIETLVNEEYEFAAANCFCRIGDDRGARVSEYPNPLKDLGTLKRWGGPFGATRKRQDECGRLCAIKAEAWLNSVSGDQLCRLTKKSGTNRILAYSKVGGSKWTVRGAGRTVKCCSSGGATTCPSGWAPEDTNFPGYCSKAVCPPIIKGDRRLYNQNKSVWGFIWNDMIYQLRKGTISAINWSECR